MARFNLDEEWYTKGHCLLRVSEYLTCENWQGRKMSSWKPKHAWVNGADKLFYKEAYDFDKWTEG